MLALSSFGRGTWAVADGADSDTIIITLMLDGGPDFRNLFVPPYNSNAGSYGNEFWKARARSHDLDPEDAAALQARWNEYFHLDHGGVQFGIHPLCGWLKDQFNADNVAIINNVFGSTNRDHAHSSLILESGNLHAEANDREQSGWGGRLANACETNVVSVCYSIRPFCYGPHPTNPMDHDNCNVLDGSDTRRMGLYEYETDLSNSNWRWHEQGYMSRALTSYYTAKRQQLSEDSLYWPILQHEQSVREFGRLVQAKLDTIPVPARFADFEDEESTSYLNSHAFRQEIKSIYDTLACREPGILNTNIISAEYTGWDDHRNLRSGFDERVVDIFGSDKGLDVLFSELGINQQGVKEKVVLLVYGEFGRQLTANGDNGTDHGVGNSMLLIGNRVTGGIYGDMFPAGEIDRFADPGSDIDGLTSFHQALGRVCEHVKIGSGEIILPGWSGTELEQGVDLAALLQS